MNHLLRTVHVILEHKTSHKCNVLIHLISIYAYLFISWVAVEYYGEGD